MLAVPKTGREKIKSKAVAGTAIFGQRGKRARARTSALSAQAAQTGRRTGLPKQMLAAAGGVLTALKSHRGQRREYPRMLAEPANQHLAVARLRSPTATREWLARVTNAARLPA